MKPTTTLALSALLSFVAAQPMMDKRDGKTVTVTDVVVVTVDVYTTVTGNPPATSSATTTTNHANHVAYHAQNKAEANAQASPSTPPLQQKAAVPASPPPAQPPTGSSPEEIQAAADAKQEAINQQQINTNNAQKQADFAHQAQMNAAQNGGPAPQAQPSAPQAPAPAASSPAPAAPQQPSTPSTGGGNGGSCGSIGGSCSGDVTIYNDQGLGACGWANDTNSEDFFALAAPMFGTYTNDAPGPHKNPYCGRMASIQVNGKSFTGMLTDRCGGCTGASIDLSQHLFSQLYPNEPPGNGRYHNVPWQFTSGPEYRQG